MSPAPLARGSVSASPPASPAASASSPLASPEPVEPFLRDVVQLSVGSAHVCALTARQRVVCWGGNESGQLGMGDQRDTRAAVPVVGAR